VNIAASLRLPLIPLPIYLNLDAVLVEDGALPRIESLRLGKVPSRRRWRIG